MTEPHRLSLTGCVIALALLAGCTPGAATTVMPSTSASPAASSPSAAASETSTPSPTSSWNPTQATAIKVVEDYFAAKEHLFADPSQFSTTEARDALGPLLGADMLKGNLNLFKQLKTDGEHYNGSARLAWTQASGIFGSGVGESVNVTVCRDPQGQVLANRSGKVLAEIPASIREFEVTNNGSGFRVVGEKEGFGDPCP